MPCKLSPEISVIIPMYNAGSFLCNMLDCLSRQSFENFEVIIIDDGSSDNSATIAIDFAKTDKRFRYFWQANSGAASARNSGIDYSSGKWLVFVDADDILENNYLEVLYSTAINTNSDICQCCSTYFDSASGDSLGDLSSNTEVCNGCYSNDEIKDILFQAMTTCPWDKIFKASLVKENGLRYQNLKYSNDAYFVLICAACAQKISFTDQRLIHYRVGNGTSLRDSMSKFPLCDLEMLNALRIGCSGGVPNAHVSLISLDTLTIKTMFWSILLLANQSAASAEIFLDEYRNRFLPSWKRLSPGFPCTQSLKLRFESWCLDSIPYKGFEWAVCNFTHDEMRALRKSQMIIISFRLLLSMYIHR